MGIDFPAEGGAEFVSTVWMSCQLVVLSTPSDERDTVGLLAARVMRPLLGSRAVGIPLQRARYRLRVVFLLLGWRSDCANRPAHHQGVQRCVHGGHLSCSFLLTSGVEFGQRRACSPVIVQQKCCAHCVGGCFFTSRGSVTAAILLRPRYLSWLMWLQLLIYASLVPLEHVLTRGAGGLATKAPSPVRGGSLTFAWHTITVCASSSSVLALSCWAGRIRLWSVWVITFDTSAWSSCSYCRCHQITCRVLP
jgi:hypothetical protein